MMQIFGCLAHLLQGKLTSYTLGTPSLPRCYAPPPPIFGRKYCLGLFYLHYTPSPHGPLEPVCGTAVHARVLVLHVLV